MGQYSQPDPYNAGVAKLAANPAVLEAAAYSDKTDLTVSIDSVATLMISVDPLIGDPGPVVTSGRAPKADDEIALGGTTARRLGKTVGDSVTMAAPSADITRELHVVGIAVVVDPVTTPTAAGAGAYVTGATMLELTRGGVPQSIAIRLDPELDKASAIEAVRRDFPSSSRLPAPQADTANLARLRRVPWPLVALIGVLSTATFVHALVMLLGRRRRDLAVLAALGMRRGERRLVGLITALLLVATGALIGLAGGLVLGRLFWQQLASRIGLASGSRAAWAPLVLGPVVALVLALVVATLVGRRSTRGSPAALIRME